MHQLYELDEVLAIIPMNFVLKQSWVDEVFCTFRQKFVLLWFSIRQTGASDEGKLLTLRLSLYLPGVIHCFY